jgi:ABC-type glycerol-3-phosphate transport system substrate-binding protein
MEVCFTMIKAVEKPVLLTVVGILSFSGLSVAKTKTLTVALWLNNPEVKPTQALFDQYEKKTGIKIKPIYTDWSNYLNKILTIIASGTIPDIIVLDRMWLPMFVEKGLVRPLDAVIKAAQFNPTTKLSEWKSGYYKKKFYGIDIWSSPNMLFYYPNMFREAGIQDPNVLLASNKWNWDTLLEIGTKLSKDTNGDGKKEQFAINQTTWIPDLVSKIWQNGGNVFNDEYTKALLDQPKSVEALAFWHDLSWRYGISPKPGESSKTAMFYEWISTYNSWSVGMKQKPQMTLQPAGKAGFATVAGGCPICISTTTKNLQDAWKFSQWFALESDMWKIVGAPASKAVFSNEYHKWLSGHFEHPELARQALENSAPEPAIHPRFKDINDIFNTNMANLAADKISASAVADKMTAELNKVLAKKR